MAVVVDDHSTNAGKRVFEEKASAIGAGSVRRRVVIRHVALGRRNFDDLRGLHGESTKKLVVVIVLNRAQI